MGVLSLCMYNKQ